MKKIPISIVILSALRWECTRKCLESLDNFTSGAYEIIVVDMGLDAGIQKYLLEEKKKRKNLKLILNPANVGTSKGRNQALKIAKGEDVFFLDNDAMVTPRWDGFLLNARQRWGKKAIIGAKIINANGFAHFCDQYIIDSQDPKDRVVGLKITQPFSKDDPLINHEKIIPWYATCGIAVDRMILNQIGGFDEKIHYVEEDKDLCFRARQAGCFIVYSPELCIVHDRPHDEIYDRRVRFGNLQQIRNDILFFENRWNCQVQLIYSRECLRKLGYSENMIEDMRTGELKSFFTVIE